VSPTVSVSSPSNVEVGGTTSMSPNSNRPNMRRRRSPVGPSGGAAITSARSDGGNSAISSAQRREPTISASRTSWLPQQWSPFAWVFTTTSIAAAAGVARRMASSITRVRCRSNRVSTRREASPSTTSPALLRPQLPSGWR
jgi:hypothetical protein